MSLSMQTKTKPQLHISMLDQMSRCGIQFQRRYGARFDVWHTEEIIPPGIALITGITVHKSVEANLKNKIATKGELLPRAEIKAHAFDEFDKIWQGGVLLTDDESMDVKNAYGKAIDQTIALAELHYDNLAPIINPIAVEKKFVIKLNGYPYDIAGQIDIVESDDSIRDTKTKASTPPADAAKTMQMGTYCMAEKVEKGKLPEKVSVDFLIKTKTPKYDIRTAIPDDYWMRPVMRRIERATEIIQSVKEGKGFFTPANPEDWCCRAKYCGYARSCKWWSGK